MRQLLLSFLPLFTLFIQCSELNGLTSIDLSKEFRNQVRKADTPNFEVILDQIASLRVN